MFESMKKKFNYKNKTNYYGKCIYLFKLHGKC